MDTRRIRNNFGRKVDLINKKQLKKVRNPYRRNNILNSYEVVYAKMIYLMFMIYSTPCNNIISFQGITREEFEEDIKRNLLSCTNS